MSKKITTEEIQKILELLSEAYEQGGKRLETAMLVDGVDDDGNMQGEMLVDNRKKEDLN